MPKHDHHQSPWSTVLTFSIPSRTVHPFRIHTSDPTISDGGMTTSGLKGQIGAVKQAKGKATIGCYSAFVACALKEEITVTKEDLKYIEVPNRSKFESAIKEHRAAANGNPVSRELLNNLAALLQHIP